MKSHKSIYIDNKASAKERGIPFLLTFDEWLKIWIDSGHLHQRGRKKGQYCLARFGDTGPYATNNVKIILHAENVIEAQIGRHPSQETRKKISDFHKGRFVSQDTKEKIAAKARFRVVSEETRKKMSVAREGKVHSIEARRKMAAANFGQKRRLGQKHTEASIEKMRMAALHRWEIKKNACSPF